MEKKRRTGVEDKIEKSKEAILWGLYKSSEMIRMDFGADSRIDRVGKEANSWACSILG